MTSALPTLFLVIIASFSLPSQARSAPMAKVAGRTLVLNGEAVRTAWGFQVYRVSLYLESLSQDARSVMKSDMGPKRIHLEMLRSVDNSTLSSAVRKSVDRNFSPREQQIYATELSQYLAALSRAGDLRAGQSVTIDYAPSKGMIVSLDTHPLAVIAGYGFYHAALRMWLENPIQTSIKEGLLATRHTP